MRSHSWSPALVPLLLVFSLCGGARAQDVDAPVDAGRPVLTRQKGHAGPITAAAFSPDGQLLVTGSVDKTVRVWDQETGKLLRSLEGHTGQVSSAAFSPCGRRVLTVSSDKTRRLWRGAGADMTARLWDVDSGRELLRIEGPTYHPWSVAFSPDGRWILTGSFGNEAHLLDAETGRVLRKFQGHTGLVSAVAFSPDGRQVLTGSQDKSARLWDTATGKEIRSFEGHSESVAGVAFSHDGRTVLTGGDDKTIRLWNADTGREIRRIEGHTNRLVAIDFSPNDRRVLSVGMDGKDETTRLWEAGTGREIWSFGGKDYPVWASTFSPDGHSVLTGSDDWYPLLLDAETGEPTRKFESHSDVVMAVAFSPDGRRILTGGFDHTAHLWDLEGGQEIRQLRGHTARIWAVAFSPDGRRALTGGEDRTARIWDTGTGHEIRRLEGHTDEVKTVVFSSDGRSVLTTSHDKTARLWSIETGREVRRFEGHTDFLISAVFSPNGAHVLTAGFDKTARSWSSETGKELHRFETGAGTPVAFSPDGRYLFTWGTEKIARQWDSETGEMLGAFEGHTWAVASALSSSDGRRVLTGSWDSTARLWDAETGREIRRFNHGSPVQSAACSPDWSWLITGSYDCTTCLWNADTGEEACRLMSFKDGTWAVVDPAGRFDASNGGDVEGLHWVVGLEPISLDQLKDRYYDPGLLAKHLGFNSEPLREVAAFDAPKLFPRTDVTPPTAEDSRLRIRLTDRGGGIGKVVVLVNGKEVSADARGGAVAPDAKDAVLELDLAGDPRVKPGEENVVQVLAYNAEGYLRSRGLGVSFTPPGEAESVPPSLYAIVCGVSDYRGEAIDLHYADKDAEDFATALRLAAEGLFGPERAHIALLSTGGAEGAVRPTRENLAEAFAAAKTAGPDDLLVVYLSGHGVNVGGQDGDFHYLLADAAGTDLVDPEVRARCAVSSAELTEWIKEIPAVKRQVLILDTCASGRLVEKLIETRNVPGSQLRALDRLKDRTGVFVLAGCAADRVSYEATRYGQGLLTYSLLLGMRGAALREESFVDVAKLFGFAADTVPELAKDIGGVQRPVVAQPKGGASFDIGRLSAEARGKVPLMQVKPLFLMTSFQDERKMRDTLGLQKAVEEELRSVASRGRETPLVFVEAREMPGAYELAGRYRVKDGAVTVTAMLFRGEEEVATFTVEGPVADLAGLAGRIVEEARSHVSR